LFGPTQIDVQIASAGYPQIPTSLQIVSPVFAFLPHGLTFAIPVTVRVPYAGADPTMVGLYTAPPGGSWTKVNGVTFEPDYALADVTHFSFFANFSARGSSDGAGGSSGEAGPDGAEGAAGDAVGAGDAQAPVSSDGAGGSSGEAGPDGAEGAAGDAVGAGGQETGGAGGMGGGSGGIAGAGGSSGNGGSGNGGAAGFTDGSATGGNAGQSGASGCGQDCLGGSCLQGQCQAVLLHAEPVGPFAIAVSDAAVYWTTDAGDLRTCPLSGCGSGPVTIATNQGSQSYVAVDTTSVYWTSFNTDGLTGGGIVKCPLSGCVGAPTKVAASPSPLQLAVDGTSVFWDTYPNNGHQVWTAPAVGGNATVFAQLDPGDAGVGQLWAMAVDTSSVYWTFMPNTQRPAVMRMNKDGTGFTSLYTAPNSATGNEFNGIAVDGNHVYWVNYEYVNDDGSATSLSHAYQMNKDGTGLLTLATLSSAISYDVKSDGTDVYWVSSGALNAVYKCAIGGCGGNPTVVAAGTNWEPVALAVDSRAVYWAAVGVGPGGTHGVMKIAK
jgi:hypothetical protein